MSKLRKKTFISYKKEDSRFKDEVVELLEKKNCIVDQTLHTEKWLKGKKEEEIIKHIIEKHIKQSSVTIVLITKNSIILDGENENDEKFKWIRREVAASLRASGSNNARNGLIILISKNANKFLSKLISNMLIKNIKNNIDYVVKVTWKDFKINPKKYLDKAFQKSRHKKWQNRIYVGK